jgi:hypothetical protein
MLRGSILTRSQRRRCPNVRLATQVGAHNAMYGGGPQRPPRTLRLSEAADGGTSRHVGSHATVIAVCL